MDIKKQSEAITAWLDNAENTLKNTKERLLETEKQLRDELAAAQSAYVDLADVTKADHVLVGVGDVYEDSYNSYRKRRVELEITGGVKMQLGEIDVPAAKINANLNNHNVRYRAVVLLFREESK